MKLNRNSKKWKELYLEKRLSFIKVHGTCPYGIMFASSEADMPDRIKEAEEYADRLFSAMR